jgi:hypothetical protein
MTPKKDIVRKAVRTLPDGSPIPSMGKGFTPRENAFIYWYTNPETEAFMNSGRAAVRAGYKPGNAVVIGYQLKKNPDIAKAIDIILDRTKEGMRGMILRIAFLCRERMFWVITDFYRQIKKPLEKPYKYRKIKNGKPGPWKLKTWEYDFEIIPLDEIPERKRLCIDNITYKGPDGRPMYILPNRHKAEKTFFKCLEVLYGKTEAQIYADTMNGRDFTESGYDDTHWKKTAEFLRGDDTRLIIAPGDGKAPENATGTL